MKRNKLMLPILAVIVGIAASAFTKVSDYQGTKSDDAYYWFEYNEDGTLLLNQTTVPSLETTDPFSCSGSGVNCSQAFTNYTETQVNGQTQYAPGTPKIPAIINEKNPE